MRCKSRDHALVALLDQQAKATADFDRWFSRIKRAMNRCDKIRQQLQRIAKKIAAHDSKPKA